MPELAEVEFYRRVWAQGLGSLIDHVELRPSARVFRDRGETPPEHIHALAGATFTSAQAHGKQLLFGFGQVGWLGVHLGMTGALETSAPNLPPGPHTHLILHFQERTLLFRDPRMFGRIRFHPGPNPPSWWMELSPPILSPGFTKPRLAAFLSKRTKSPIKALLLDQTLFPGIGNWMADEVLWRSQIHPGTPAGALTPHQTVLLWRRIREVARDALRVIAPDWGAAPDTWLFNHRWKDGGICPRPRCQTPLLRASLRGRTSCWCPNCQILPSG